MSVLYCVMFGFTACWFMEFWGVCLDARAERKRQAKRDREPVFLWPKSRK